MDRDLAPFGLTLATARPLAYLEILPLGTTQRELAAKMDIDTSALVRIFDELERTGLIERRVDAVDRRLKRIYLTDAGRRTYAVFEKVAADLESRLFAAVADRRPVLGALDEALEVAARLRAPDADRAPRARRAPRKP